MKCINCRRRWRLVYIEAAEVTGDGRVVVLICKPCLAEAINLGDFISKELDK